MAFAAVFFALPLAVASAITMVFLRDVGLAEMAIFYLAAGGGTMLAFLIAGSLTASIDQT